MSPPDAAPAVGRPIQFDNSYTRLPERFYARLSPTPVAAPRSLHVNRPLAALLGIDADWLASDAGIATIAGNVVPDGAASIALAYAGHQFGHFVPQLGDGRALLLGEVIGRDGVRYDIQLKGSGRTPFSRSGDGRAAIGPVLRELIVSEGMAALGIPTTRVLAAVTTGEPVFRETILPGAVLARVARGHVRIGTFQYFAARSDVDALRELGDYVIARTGVDVAGAPNRYGALLEAVVARTAALVARWQSVGFIHGVMNTDNVSVAGETIDYGPCAFMDAYHPGTVYSSIDQQGRYAYGNQPTIAHWNLAKLAESLLPLLGETQAASLEIAQSAIDRFPGLFEADYLDRMRAKLGFGAPHEDDADILSQLLELMAENGSDFTLAFRRLSRVPDANDARREEAFRSLFSDQGAVGEWLERWRRRISAEGQGASALQSTMLKVNPAVIPRNHRVEAALKSAEADGDLSELERLLGVLASPFDERHEDTTYAMPPRPDEVVHATFCGT